MSSNRLSRRRFLAFGTTSVIAPSLAGCSQPLNFETYFDQFALENDTTPAELHGEFKATMIETLSPTHPPALQIRYTASDSVRITFEHPAPFSSNTGTQRAGPATLQLERQDLTTERTNECWIGHQLGKAPDTRTIGFEAGDQITLTQSVLNLPASDACYAPGEYRFEDSYTTETGDYS